MRTVIFALLFFAGRALAIEKEDLVGDWVMESFYDITGSGFERRAVFSLDGPSLMLTFKTLFSSRVSKKELTPREPVSDGPYRVKQLTEDELVYVRNGDELHVTIRLNQKGILEWGALVSSNNKDWRYAREAVKASIDPKTPSKVTSGLARWTFKTDPFEVPVGEASVQGLGGGTAFYIYEKIPAYESGGEPLKVIRVMTRNEDKSLSEQFRLVWGNFGSPHFEGVFSRSENLRVLKTLLCYRVREPRTKK